MPLHVYAASRALGFREYAADKPRANTTPNEYAWQIVAKTGDEALKSLFSMGCTSAVLVGKLTLVMTQQSELGNKQWETLPKTKRLTSGRI